MTVLGIETSCDETAVAIVKKENNSFHILSSSIASSLKLHAETGGIIPEIAAREQIKYMIPTLKDACDKASIPFENITDSIDAIAVTNGPGLIGSLLVGIETAKTLSLLLKKPLIPVNHLYGHLYANWAENPEIAFPALGLVVSGGHTDLVLMKSHHDIKKIGSTRDDAAGEAFDKIGRLLGLPYPAGPLIAKRAEQGNNKAFLFPRPLIGSGDFDFSFSGLKTAVFREVQSSEKHSDVFINDICASVQQAIVSVLVKKTGKAAKYFGVKSVLLGGGVSANELLRTTMDEMLQKELPTVTLFTPSKNLCTDNAAMIALASFFHDTVPSLETIKADPELYFSE